MNRDEAVEAAARAIDPQAWNGDQLAGDRRWRQAVARQHAAAALDAIGWREPIRWDVLNHYGTTAYSGIENEAEALELARAWNAERADGYTYRVIALMPVERGEP